jgi:hypothetical protein
MWRRIVAAWDLRSVKYDVPSQEMFPFSNPAEREKCDLKLRKAGWEPMGNIDWVPP